MCSCIGRVETTPAENVIGHSAAVSWNEVVSGRYKQGFYMTLTESEWYGWKRVAYITSRREYYL